jgi:hypothetical protein
MSCEYSIARIKTSRMAVGWVDFIPLARMKETSSVMPREVLRAKRKHRTLDHTTFFPRFKEEEY